MFHLTTHAFFKALLFLGAGSVIIAHAHEQDIWKMGNLRKKMPVTFWTFLIGTLALSGVPPFSGFYSKDSILAQALEQKNYLLFVVGVFIAGLTAFYMFRLFYRRFPRQAENRSRRARARIARGHDLAAAWCWPCLRSLAASSAPVRSTPRSFRPMKRAESFGQSLLEPFVHSPAGVLIGLAFVAAGIFAATKFYWNAASDPLPAKLGGLATAMKNHFYFDEALRSHLHPRARFHRGGDGLD